MSKKYTLGPDVPADELVYDSNGNLIDDGYIDHAIEDVHRTHAGARLCCPDCQIPSSALSSVQDTLPGLGEPFLATCAALASICRYCWGFSSVSIAIRRQTCRTSRSWSNRSDSRAAVNAASKAASNSATCSGSRADRIAAGEVNRTEASASLVHCGAGSIPSEPAVTGVPPRPGQGAAGKPRPHHNAWASGWRPIALCLSTDFRTAG